MTIYAKDLPPSVRSSFATGLYTPDSRICLEEHATAAFKQTWEQMARQSFATYQSFLGVSGTPVEFIDNYFVSDDAPEQRRSREPDNRAAFADLQRELTGDLIPHGVEFEPGRHPLGNRYVQRDSQLMFNLTEYTRTLLVDFTANGGKMEIAEFHTPNEFARLKERTLVNATGYGARALFGDATEEADAAKGASAEADPPGKIGGQTIEGEVRKETSAKS